MEGLLLVRVYGESNDAQFRGAKQQKGTILGPHSIPAQLVFFPILQV